MNRHTSITGSLGSAARGLAHGRRSRNLKIILIIILVVAVMSFVLPVTSAERLVLLVAILAVLGAELFNTAIEELCDVVTMEHHPGIARAKELSAAAVLAVSIAAVLAGLYIFIPYLQPAASL